MIEITRSRKEIEEENRKQYILDIAERLFATNGFHETSVSDIAKESEFGIGTLYKYFKDKDSILDSIFKAKSLGYFNMLESSLDIDGQPIDIVNSLIDRYIDYVYHNQNFFKLHFAYFHSRPKILSEDSMKDKHRDMFYEKLSGIFDEGKKLGQFADIDSDYLASALFGMCISFFFVAMDKYGHDWNVDELKKGMKQVFFEQVKLVD